MRLLLATMMIARIATAFRSNGGSIVRQQNRAAFGVLPSQSSSTITAKSIHVDGNIRRSAWFTNTRRYMSETIQQEEEAAAAPASTGYPFANIESKWQKYWMDNQTFATPERRSVAEDGTVIKSKNKKKYVLDMFPYPSGAGLHVGHPEGYTGEYSYHVEF